MRHGLQQYEEALSLGRAHRLPEDRVEGMAREYFRLLVDTKQEERAAALKEKEVRCRPSAAREGHSPSTLFCPLFYRLPVGKTFFVHQC